VRFAAGRAITIDPPEICVIVGRYSSDLETGSRLLNRDPGDPADVPDQCDSRTGG
jgi:hypothetical protein